MAHGYLHEGYGMWGDLDPDREGRDHDRSFMFEGRGRDRFRGERGDEGEWFGGRDRFEDGGGWERGRTSFSSNPDDHYRSWRDKQMSALDRDYADYCREREQQFHQDFDSWRESRHGNPQPMQTGMTDTGLSTEPSGERAMANDATGQPDTEQESMGTATPGSPSGRSRR